MNVLFYDQKNHCEVKSSDLMRINLTRNKLVMDEYNRKIVNLPETIGTIGYKSKNCPTSHNWDNWCNDSDLIFLRVIE